MSENCFVIMPIGTQSYEGREYTEKDLKDKYDNLIKDAILKARPNFEITRADDIAMPGSITNDIFTRIMYSQYVIADISLPNPNVFYELGLRHAIRNGTILIKDKDINNKVFDISHLRYIEYENSPTGLKTLSEHLAKTFTFIENNPNKIDNQFLELAALTKYNYPKFIDQDEELRKKNMAMVSIIKPFIEKPNLFRLLLDSSINEDEKNKKILEEISNDPGMLGDLLMNLASSGFLK